jgi:chemotaxis protein methyltransferase CheR
MPARVLPLIILALSRLPLVGEPIGRRVWYPWRHKLLLLYAKRENYTFTEFVRLPHQLKVLADEVIAFLRSTDRSTPLRIVVFGCSNGSEPYSMASTLASRHPDLNVEVSAFDIEPEVIAKAKSGRFTLKEAKKNAWATPEFMAATFVPAGEDVEVRPEIRSRINFHVGDVLDANLIATIEQADIVVAQNFLYHLERRLARRAFAHLCSLMKPRSALFIDGMDIDLRHALTKKAGLQPLDRLIPEIHADATALRGNSWPWIYWGLEPLDTKRADWTRRYATVFLRQSASPSDSA